MFNRNAFVISVSLALALVAFYSFESLQTPIGDDNETITNTVANPIPVEVDTVEHPSRLNTGEDFELYRGLKTLFDSIISEQDTTDKNQLLAAAKSYCKESQYSEKACQLFLDLFTRFVEYKISLSQIDYGPADPNSLLAEIEYRQEKIKAIRSRFFSESETQVLFSEEDSIETHALARYSIAKDPTLSREQKRRMLDVHFAEMSEHERAAFAPSLTIQSLLKVEQSEGSQHDKLAQIRAQFGDDAADRLKKSWQEQDAFTQKVKEIAPYYSNLTQDEKWPFLKASFSSTDARRARVLLENPN